MPWATALTNVMLPLQLTPACATRRSGERGRRGAGRGRADRLRARLSARAVGRHEDARLDRARAGDAAQGAADGRAVRRARRDHPPQAQRRPAGAVGERERFTVVFVTHSVFEIVYLSQRIVVMAARPGRVIADLAIDAPYPRDAAFRTSPDYAAHCRASRQLWQRIAQSGRCDGRDERARRHGRERSGVAERAGWLAAWRILAGRARPRRLGCGSRRAAWPASRPTSCPGRSLICQHAGRRLGDAVGLAAGSRCGSRGLALLAAVLLGGVAGGAVHPVEMARAVALPLCGHPAGDADRGDRAADHHLGQRHRRCRC